jgi:hypothetical protein
MAYDSGIISFTTKTDKVDLVSAAHINAVQTEIVTIETILGTNVKGNRADLKTRLNNALDADGTILSGSSYPSPSLPSQLYYRTDLDVLYIMNAANSLWVALGGSLSNVLFQYSGCVNATGAGEGEVIGTTLVPNSVTGNYRFLQRTAGSLGTVWASKWTKISGVATITVYAQIWVRTTGTATLKVDVGGQNNSVTGTSAQTTPEWKSMTIDVSSLTNGVTYDVTVQLNNSVTTAFLGTLISFGS